jgi:hypothetical protein
VRACKIASQISRTAPRPPPIDVTQCAIARISACASAGAIAIPASLHRLAIDQVVTDVGDRLVRHAELGGQLRHHLGLVAGALDQVLDPELLRAPLHRRAATRRDPRDVDAGLEELAQPQPVADVEVLALAFTINAIVEPTVGEHTVDVTHQELHLREALQRDHRSPSQRARGRIAPTIQVVERASMPIDGREVTVAARAVIELKPRAARPRRTAAP